MQTVWEIIELFGGLDALKRQHIRLENRGYMPLVIECVGEGPRDLPLISVAHTYVQNGDVMYDPEMTFEVDPGHPGEWGPITYRQDNLGFHQVAVWRTEQGQVMLRPALVRELKSFARMWNKNLRDQGFLDAARAAVEMQVRRRA